MDMKPSIMARGMASGRPYRSWNKARLSVLAKDIFISLVAVAVAAALRLAAALRQAGARDTDRQCVFCCAQFASARDRQRRTGMSGRAIPFCRPPTAQPIRAAPWHCSTKAFQWSARCRLRHRLSVWNRSLPWALNRANYPERHWRKRPTATSSLCRAAPCKKTCLEHPARQCRHIRSGQLLPAPQAIIVRTSVDSPGYGCCGCWPATIKPFFDLFDGRSTGQDAAVGCNQCRRAVDVELLPQLHIALNRVFALLALHGRQVAFCHEIVPRPDPIFCAPDMRCFAFRIRMQAFQREQEGIDRHIVQLRKFRLQLLAVRAIGV